MTSPPHRSPATSPPYPPHIPLPNPKKRPSLSMSGPSMKRQKRTSIHSATSAATSTHPLRQTSFPPEESAVGGERSPSVESDFTAVTGGRSVVTTGTTKRGRGKGKGKGKGKKKVEGSVKSGGRAKTVDGARAESELPEDDDDDDQVAMIDEGKVVDAEAEKDRIRVLFDALDTDQKRRYAVMRAVKLKVPTVRKIVNQTVSQSVPPGVIIIINGYTKTFIGTLIEKAREVQAQWAAIETPPFIPPKIPVDPTNNHSQNLNDDVFAASGSGGSSALLDLTMAARGTDEQKTTKALEPSNLGPLLPDHLREALRRYKRDGEGGGTGLTGVSVGLGLQGAGSQRLGGRRLFR